MSSPSETSNSEFGPDKTLGKLNQTLEALATGLKAISEVMSTLKDSNLLTKNKKIITDENGELIINSDDIPSNHLDSSNAFKCKDTDVDRFLSMCRRQFNYYEKFYSFEKKRVEFIEAHLGSASDWYYTFMSQDQNEHPDSGILLEELAKYYSTDIPDSLKLRKLLNLKHKWGNAVDFTTKFKLYSTQLQVPEILQLRLFEDRVQPFVKTKLLNLEPNSRTIENYSRMLVTYDNERYRHWSAESLKRNISQISSVENRTKKKFKSWNKSKATIDFNEKKLTYGFSASNTENPSIPKPSYINSSVEIPNIFIQVNIGMLHPGTAEILHTVAILDPGSAVNLINYQLAEDWELPLIPDTTTVIFPNKKEYDPATTQELMVTINLRNHKGKIVEKKQALRFSLSKNIPYGCLLGIYTLF
eukprot:jgi/Orpsp1_1/1175232/evm.model.c7180000053105.1